MPVCGSCPRAVLRARRPGSGPLRCGSAAFHGGDSCSRRGWRPALRTLKWPHNPRFPEEDTMTKLYSYAGIAASIILIAFGAGSIYMGFDGRDRVRDDLAREQIVGPPDPPLSEQKVHNSRR